MLCSCAHQFPSFVERFLQQGSRLNRRFREETVTDILMGGLISAGSRAIFVDYPNETSTGADMRWDFVNRGGGTIFSLFIQAKKLYERTSTWRDHSYNELFHLTGSTGFYQAQILCDHARGQSFTYPLYAFYNQGRSCGLARADGITNVQGLTLADGYEIERRVIAATTAPMRRSTSSLGALQPLYFPITDILCPGLFMPLGPMAFQPGSDALPPITFDYVNGKWEAGFLLPPRPEDIRERLVDALSLAATAAGTKTSDVPPVCKTIPQDVVSRIERHQAGFRPHDEYSAPYWTVTVVSTNPPSGD